MEGNSKLTSSVQAGSSTKKNIYGHFSEVSQLLRGLRVLMVSEWILGGSNTLFERLEEILFWPLMRTRIVIRGSFFTSSPTLAGHLIEPFRKLLLPYERYL